MGLKTLYSIGHSNRKAEEFLALLKRYSIEYLIDVRSQPYSKFNPQFNQDNLTVLVEKNQIRYIFMGDLLGGRPKDTSCYTSAGKVDYEVVETKDFFKQGIKRLKTACTKDISVALMCSEGKPGECHRSKLIGRVLSVENIVLQHIDEKGQLKDQTTVIAEVNEGLPGLDLFGNPVQTTSKKFYE